MVSTFGHKFVPKSSLQHNIDQVSKATSKWPTLSLSSTVEPYLTNTSSETSPKCINREGLGKRRTRIIGNVVARLFVTQTFISVDEMPWSHHTTPLRTIYFWRFYKTKVDFLFRGRGGGCYSERVEVTLYLLTSIFLCSEQRCLHRCWFCFLLPAILKRFFIDEQERLHNWPL